MEHTSARPADYMEQMLGRYGNMLYRLCLITLGNESDAEDAVQETFGISQYKIVDADGKVIVKNAKTEMTELAGDTVLLEIPVEKCTGGKYQLLVECFVGGAKADKPLEIHGAWSCEFVR